MKRAASARARQTMLLAVLGIEVAVVLTLFGPRWLRHMDVFRVRRVEVVGTRYLDAGTAVRVSGITLADNVFDDLSPVRDRIQRLRMVQSARVKRRLPGTIVIQVAEVQPVALVETPELRPVDAHGDLLPIDPAGLAMDLPVVGVHAAADGSGRLTDSTALSLVRLAARIRREAPEIAARVSMLEPRAHGVMVTLRKPGNTRVLLPATPEPLHFAELRAALNDLAARGELDRVRGIDLRYRDQAIIAFGI